MFEPACKMSEPWPELPETRWTRLSKAETGVNWTKTQWNCRRTRKPGRLIWPKESGWTRRFSSGSPRLTPLLGRIHPSMKSRPHIVCYKAQFCGSSSCPQWFERSYFFSSYLLSLEVNTGEAQAAPLAVKYVVSCGYRTILSFLNLSHSIFNH